MPAVFHIHLNNEYRTVLVVMILILFSPTSSRLIDNLIKDFSIQIIPFIFIKHEKGRDERRNERTEKGKNEGTKEERRMSPL
jgi:hypothetical protein